jgi:hypothetical protein
MDSELPLKTCDINITVCYADDCINVDQAFYTFESIIDLLCENLVLGFNLLYAILN